MDINNLAGPSSASVRSETVNCAEFLPRAYLRRGTLIYILSGKINTITEVCRYYTENLPVSFAYAAAGRARYTVRECRVFNYARRRTRASCAVRYAAELRSFKRDGDVSSGRERERMRGRDGASRTGWTRPRKRDGS